MEGDVASDLSVFHRIDDMYSMGSRRWAQLVSRLLAYSGAVQLTLRIQQSTPEPEGGGVEVPEAVLAPQAPPSPLRADKVVESSKTALQFSDIGDMFSFG